MQPDFPPWPAIVWMVALGATLLGGPLWVVVSRKDPSPWVVFGVAAMFSGTAVFPQPPPDWRSVVKNTADGIGLFLFYAGTMWALYAAAARSPPAFDADEPPAPAGPSGALAQMGFLVACSVAFVVLNHPYRGRYSFDGPVLLLGFHLPLLLLSLRKGARAARVRLGAGAFFVGLGLVSGLRPAYESGLYGPDVVVPFCFAALAYLAGWGDARAADAWVRQRRGPWLVATVLIAGVLARSPQAVSAFETNRLAISVWRMDKASVPRASRAWTLPYFFRFATVGDGVRLTALGPIAPPEVMALSPGERVPAPTVRRPWLSWLAFDPAGEPRVATLIGAPPPHHNEPWPWWVPADAIGVRRASAAADGEPRFVLQGDDVPLRFFQLEPRIRLGCESHQVALAVDVADEWTAQELFDACAYFGCTVEPHNAACWDSFIAP